MGDIGDEPVYGWNWPFYGPCGGRFPPGDGSSL
jgi:hypothetical protein